MRTRTVALAVLLAVPARLAGQAPEAAPLQPPVFGVAVDMVALDASVVDADGRPVLGLGPEDFHDRGGRQAAPPRLGRVRRARPRAAGAAARAALRTSARNEDAPKGRLVLLLVDRGNIGRGGGREVLKAADRFMSTLAPGDRVGLAFVPGPGPGIEFTPDLDDVRRSLKGVLGMADRGGSRVPLAVAIAHVQRSDRIRWTEFLALQCGGSLPELRTSGSETGDVVPFSAARLEQCQSELEAEAAQVFLAYRERSLATQSALTTTFQSLGRIEGAKTVVLISEGLGTEASSEVRDLALEASKAQVSLFVVLLDTSNADASFNYSAVASQEDREIEAGGLFDLATQSRGAVLRVVGSGDAAFQRIARELMGYYLLGFEPEAGDRDGRGHQVRVSVSRPKVTVRARGLLSIPSAPPTPEALLASALRSPLVDRGLPVQATAFALRDGASGKVRLLIAARVGRASRPVSVGFALSGPGGQGGGEPGLRGHRWRGRRVGRVHGRGGRGPSHLQPAPCRGGRGRPARQRRAHGEGRARLGGRDSRSRTWCSRLRRPGEACARPSIWSWRAAASRPSWKWPAAIRPASAEADGRPRAGGLGGGARPPPGPGDDRAGGEGRDARGPHRDRRRAPAARRLRRPGGGLPRGQAGGGRHAAVPHRPAPGRDRHSSRPARRSPRRDATLRPGRAPEAGHAAATSWTAWARSSRARRRREWPPRSRRRGRAGPRPWRTVSGRAGRTTPARRSCAACRYYASGNLPAALTQLQAALRLELGALPGGGLHGRLLRCGRQGPRRGRGMADRPHRRGGQPGALRAPQRCARPGEGGGAGAWRS